MRPLALLLAGRVLAPVIAGMCHWTQGRGDARQESHEAFHFGYSCPYAAMAAVLRGEPDPRDADASLPVG